MLIFHSKAYWVDDAHILMLQIKIRFCSNLLLWEFPNNKYDNKMKNHQTHLPGQDLDYSKWFAIFRRWMATRKKRSRFSFGIPLNYTVVLNDAWLMLVRQKRTKKKLWNSIRRNNIFVRLHWLTSAFHCGNRLLFSIQLTPTIFLKWNWWCFHLLLLPLFLTHSDLIQHQHTKFMLSNQIAMQFRWDMRTVLRQNTPEKYSNIFQPL